MDLIDKLGFYAWVIVVGFIGGILGLASKGRRKIADFIIGTITSMFLGWIGYEIINAFAKNEKIALASCGFIAWRGAEWVRNVFDEILKNKVKDDDFKGF